MKKLWKFESGNLLFVSYGSSSEQINRYLDTAIGDGANNVHTLHTCEGCDGGNRKNWCHGGSIRIASCDCDCHVWDDEAKIELSPRQEGE